MLKNVITNSKEAVYSKTFNGFFERPGVKYKMIGRFIPVSYVAVISRYFVLDSALFINNYGITSRWRPGPKTKYILIITA